MIEPLTPDSSQASVIDFDPKGRLVVTAGPGSGKTSTAALRISKILDSVDVGLPILAVTFSRAAAHAIRSSCWRNGCKSGIRFATLDSWARSYVGGFGDGPEVAAANFDAVIERATALLRSRDAEMQICSHLVVDEAQDVSGLRRELILEMMSRTSTGWTVLGDLAQKIFDFEPDRGAERDPGAVVDDEDSFDSVDVLKKAQFPLPFQIRSALKLVPDQAREQVLTTLRGMWDGQVHPSISRETDTVLGSTGSEVASVVDDRLSILEWCLSSTAFDAEIRQLSLTVDHRSKTVDLKSVREFGRTLRTNRADIGTVDDLWSQYLDLKQIVVDLKPGAIEKDQLSGKLHSWGKRPESTAVLMRSQSDLLALGRHLSMQENPVPYEVIPTRDQELVPMWVAGLVGARTEDQLREKIPEDLDPDVVISMIKARYFTGGQFDEGRLAEDLRSGRAPEFLKTRVPKGVLLSTIHRVKGLEFDRVILSDWERPMDDDDSLNEARVMFVGLTRASSEQWALKFKSGTSFSRCPSDRTRHLECAFARGSRFAVGIEVKNSDLRLTRPIAENVDVILQLDDERVDSPVRYVLTDADGSIEYGFTLDRFGDAARVAIGGRNKKVPTRLHGLLRAGSCTIAPEPHQRSVWGDKKIAVAPVLAGIVKWKED